MRNNREKASEITAEAQKVVRVRHAEANAGMANTAGLLPTVFQVVVPCSMYGNHCWPALPAFQVVNSYTMQDVWAMVALIKLYLIKLYLIGKCRIKVSARYCSAFDRVVGAWC